MLYKLDRNSQADSYVPSIVLTIVCMPHPFHVVWAHSSVQDPHHLSIHHNGYSQRSTVQIQDRRMCVVLPFVFPPSIEIWALIAHVIIPLESWHR